MELVDSIVAGITAAVLVAWFAAGQVLWPAAVVLLGALVIPPILYLSEGRPTYAGACATYFLSSSILFLAISPIEAPYNETVAVSGLILGGASFTIMLSQYAGHRVVESISRKAGNEDAATAIYEAISAFIGLLLMVWVVVTAGEKLTRYGGVAIGGSTTFALNALGIEIPIPMVILDGSIDMTMFLFMSCLILGFHTIDTFVAGWRATKITTKAGVSGAKLGASAAGTAAGKAGSAAFDGGNDGGSGGINRDLFDVGSGDSDNDEDDDTDADDADDDSVPETEDDGDEEESSVPDDTPHDRDQQESPERLTDVIGSMEGFERSDDGNNDPETANAHPTENDSEREESPRDSPVDVSLSKETWRKLNSRRREPEENIQDVIERLLSE